MSTISELIALLQYVADKHGDLVVVLAKDAEGNEFSTWSDYSIGFFDPNYNEYDDQDLDPGDENCVALWP